MSAVRQGEKGRNKIAISVEMSARKYAVDENQQPKVKRRVKKWRPISICELLFCDWDYKYEVDADMSHSDALFEANGEGYVEGSPLRQSTSSVAEISMDRAAGPKIRAHAAAEGDAVDEGSNQASAVLRRRVAKEENEASEMQRRGSAPSVLDVHHEDESGEDSREEAEDDDSTGDWREKRPPSLTMPHSPPGASPAQDSCQDETEEEDDASSNASPALGMPGSVNADVEVENRQLPDEGGDGLDTSSAVASPSRLADVGRPGVGAANDASETGAPAETAARAPMDDRGVDDYREELGAAREPLFGGHALADRDAGLSPSKALKQLMGAEGGDAEYKEVRSKLRLEEALETPLEEVLAPVDEMSSFMSQRHNLFTPYAEMPKSLLLPYSNYEAYGQPRTFSTAPPGGLVAAKAEGGALQLVEGQDRNRGEGSPESYVAARDGVTGLSSAVHGNGTTGVITPSWMGPK